MDITLTSLVALCLLQSATYAAAAVFVRRGDHDSLVFCYAASSLIYALVAICHGCHG